MTFFQRLITETAPGQQTLASVPQIQDGLTGAISQSRLIVTAGFAETGPAGRAAEEQLVAKIEEVRAERRRLVKLPNTATAVGASHKLEADLLKDLRELRAPKHTEQASPVAGMTDAETEFTAELFKSLVPKHSLMVVEHDMGFVGSIADHVTVLHQGSVLAEGSLDQVQNDERVIEVYLGR